MSHTQDYSADSLPNKGLSSPLVYDTLFLQGKNKRDKILSLSVPLSCSARQVMDFPSENRPEQSVQCIRDERFPHIDTPQASLRTEDFVDKIESMCEGQRGLQAKTEQKNEVDLHGKSDFDFDFKEGDYDSDMDSVLSEEDESFSFGDWQSGSSIFDSFELRYYVLRTSDGGSVRYNNDEFLVDTILAGYRSHEGVTAVRLLADIHSLDNEEDIRWSQNIRFEVSNFESVSELRQVMLEHLSNETAPVWHRLLTDETSDKGYNKLVKYHRDYFDFCIQKTVKSRVQVTTISGEEEIHPGVFVKMVTDHNIGYLSNDCLIKCLNESFPEERKDPVEIRKQLRPNGNYEKDIHTPRHINAIGKIFNTRICISDLVEQTNIAFNKECQTRSVKLVKVGKVLGILDRVDHTVDKRNTSRDLAFFDLETVGPDQRVYAFTWRHHQGDMTMCHNNVDIVEALLAEKIVDVLNSAGDNDTITAYSWNGSRFDSWIVFKLLKKKYNKKLWIHDIIVNSANELLTFKLTIYDGSVKKHMVFKDPKKMFSMSIPEACKVFFPDGISTCGTQVAGELKKHDFNHDEVDEAYMQGKFDDYIKENKGKIMDYVRQDGVLLEKLTNCIADLYKQEDINMYTVLTRSVASSIAWQKTIEQHKILKDVTLSPYAQICDGVRYNDIMDHAIGGRTQCVQRGTFQNVCGIDVNSMYPYVCANREYPCGQIVELLPSPTDRFAGGREEIINPERIPKDKLGIYYVRIKKQSYPHVVPYRKSKHYAYNWEYAGDTFPCPTPTCTAFGIAGTCKHSKNGEFEKWITNIDLEQIDDYEVLKGFYWTDKTDKFYKDFMMDNYNERISIDKSDPRNMHIKLKMNGVTGSVFQHSFREMVMIFTKEEFEENVKKYSELVTVIGCESINDRQYIVTMRPVKFKEGDLRIKAQREFCKGAITQKPWVLTMFTYSYARKVLRDEWIKLEQKGCKIIYCDTDSLFFVNPETSTSAVYEQSSKPMDSVHGRGSSERDGRVDTKNLVVKRDEYTHKDKELGKWSIECWNDEGSFYTPKVYAIKNIGKLRIKGVGYNSLVTNTEHGNSDLNYEQKLKLFLECVKNPRCDLHNDINCASCPKRGGVHPSYKHVKELIEGKPLKTINFIMEKSSQHGIQKKYEIKVIR